MSWQVEDTLGGQLTGIDVAAGTEQYSSARALNPGELASFEVVANLFPAATDDMVVYVYHSVDGTVWPDTPNQSFVLSTDFDPHTMTFEVSGPKYVRLGFLSSGATDRHTAVDVRVVTDGVSA